MAGYEKTTWNEGIAPGISAELLNHLETQFEEFEKVFGAHTILMAISDNTPIPLVVVASRVVGRKASGNIVALTGAEVLALIGRIGKGNLEWANAKLLLGAGAGSSPTEIAVPVPKTIATGSYVGTANGGANCQDISVGFKCSAVIVQTTEGAEGDETIVYIPNMVIKHSGGNHIKLSNSSLHATDGFTVCYGDDNKEGRTYYYWAISE